MTTRLRQDILSTLIINGFHVTKAQRHPEGSFVVSMHRYDQFGARIEYVVLFASDDAITSLVKSTVLTARSHNALPLVVSNKEISNKCKRYSYEEFFAFFGGVINTGLLLLPNLPEVMATLGKNKLPPGLTGEPEDIHEIYVKECLSFVLESPTRRYGIDRRFESVPDGIVLGKNRLNFLYDSKAYSITKRRNGFKFTADDLKRFAAYVKDYDSRYATYLGKAFTFLVVTGSFDDSEASIQNRSDELYRDAGCRLTCVTSEELARIVQLVMANASERLNIRWDGILNKLFVRATLVTDEVRRVKKDRLVIK
jgi:hypothetical protein